MFKEIIFLTLKILKNISLAKNQLSSLYILEKNCDLNLFPIQFNSYDTFIKFIFNPTIAIKLGLMSIVDKPVYVNNIDIL
jgi:hypothetical protein